MWPIARARAAGVLLTLAILLIPSSPGSSRALSDLVTADSQPATAAAMAAAASGHRPDATGTHPAAGQLAPFHGRSATTSVDRRADRDGQVHGGPAALAAALLAAALLFGVGCAGHARSGGWPAVGGRGPRSPPRLLSA